MKNFQVKSFNFEVKSTGENEFEGYASVFRNIDSYRDVIEPGAFSKTIQENKRVKVLWQHDPHQPIGRPIHMEEDNHGLYVKAKISDTTLGREAMALMRDGVIDELSIGFNTVKEDWDKEAQVRRIKEVKLWEFSPVTFAANDAAIITGVKNNGLDALLFNLNNELKAGKMLSEKNATIVKDAIEALQALLSASEGKGVEPPGAGTQQLSEDEQKAAKDIMDLMAEMRKWGGKH